MCIIRLHAQVETMDNTEAHILHKTSYVCHCTSKLLGSSRYIHILSRSRSIHSCHGETAKPECQLLKEKESWMERERKKMMGHDLHWQVCLEANRIKKNWHG